MYILVKTVSDVSSDLCCVTVSVTLCLLHIDRLTCTRPFLMTRLLSMVSLASELTYIAYAPHTLMRFSQHIAMGYWRHTNSAMGDKWLKSLVIGIIPKNYCHLLPTHHTGYCLFINSHLAYKISILSALATTYWCLQNPTVGRSARGSAFVPRGTYLFWHVTTLCAG